MLALGWWLAPITLYHLLPMYFDAASWRELFPAANRPARLSFFWMRWIRAQEAVEVDRGVLGLLPLGQMRRRPHGARADGHGQPIMIPPITQPTGSSTVSTAPPTASRCVEGP